MDVFTRPPDLLGISLSICRSTGNVFQSVCSVYYLDLFFCLRSSLYLSLHGRRPGAEFGGTKKIFGGPISGKISIFRVKISDDLFFSYRPGSSDFPFFSHIFLMFTMLNVVYDHFLTRKTQFFTLFMLSRTSDNTTSQNIGGDQCMAGPPPHILGGPSPQSPLGLRPWKL